MENKLQNKGLTLLELLVAVSVFVVVITMVSGLFAIALKYQRKSSGNQELLAETSYLMEYTGRQLRMAKTYDSSNPDHIACFTPDHNTNYVLTESVSVVPPPGIGKIGHGIKFINYEGKCVKIYLDSVSDQLMLEKEWSGGDTDSEPLTSDNLKVEKFDVLLVTEASTVNLQDRVTFFLGVKSKEDNEASVLNIQTTVSQRSLNVD